MTPGRLSQGLLNRKKNQFTIDPVENVRLGGKKANNYPLKSLPFLIFASKHS